MKKNSIFLTILLFAFTAGYSQIKVNSSGKVGINNLNPSFNLDCNGTSFFNVVPTYNWGIHIESAGFMGGAAIYPDGPSSLGLTDKRWYEGYITNLHTGSDARFKTNVSTMDNVLLNIMKVRSVNYDLSDYFFQKSFNGLSSKNFHHTKNRKGFVAQELLLIFPELVKYDSINDIYFVNYLEFIPIILAGIQEQQNQIETLQSVITAQEQEISDIKKYIGYKDDGSKKSLGTSTSVETPILYQNSPNPFSESTTIRYFLTDEFNDAYIIIYDMTGLQLKSIPLEDVGESSVEISAGQLRAGMYIYSLIVDGKLTDSKQMIITE